MRLLFAGSPAIAVPSLEALVRSPGAGSDWELVGVLTNPDTPKGRHGTPEPTPVGLAAQALNEELSRTHPAAQPPAVLKPDRLDAAARDAVLRLKPDLLVSFAYGRIFGPLFMACFPQGGINVHPSLLPKYRGATPIPAAILNRETETGISVQRIAAAMDEGDILAQERLPLAGTETTASLGQTVATRAAPLLVGVIAALAAGSLTATVQDPAQASYCGLIAKEDGLLDWSLGAADLDARIRAFTPWPLCWTRHRDQTLYVLEARPWPERPSGLAQAVPGTVLGIDKRAGILVQTGDGLLALTRLQYEAKKALDWRSFVNGARDFIGSRLG